MCNIFLSQSLLSVDLTLQNVAHEIVKAPFSIHGTLSFSEDERSRYLLRLRARGSAAALDIDDDNRSLFGWHHDYYPSGYQPEEISWIDLPTFRLVFDGGISNDYRMRENGFEFRINEGGGERSTTQNWQFTFALIPRLPRWLRRRSLGANPHGRISR